MTAPISRRTCMQEAQDRLTSAIKGKLAEAGGSHVVVLREADVAFLATFIALERVMDWVIEESER